MTETLQNRTVLVTGAARGIGAACAHAFADAGARVACADLTDPAETVAMIRAAGGQASAFQCDVSDEASILTLFATIDDQLPPLDVLVHCAGIIHEAPLLETSAEEFDSVVAVNLRGSFLVGREAIRALQDRPGRIILTASDLSYYGRETFSPYVASKHGVLGLVRSWAREFAPSILVNALCPGPIDTDMLAAENMTPEWRQKELAIPLARFGQPQEIAQMALFLAGPNAAYITGQGIGVNGGSVMP
ncbi:SDR family NAD(P)-dependent oxidoreductase [uncultured Roseovarius sp.]|uniref:SDR family NAD(P)-dependent oxidoreductase n=1 Tax=uncultured Roseovarius sp. TaxID=293344 RepID=UPI00261DCDD2|nr:SDR family NAD(P)-dependent oxidoreductase [uncultured Roseovarius sp.]